MNKFVERYIENVYDLKIDEYDYSYNVEKIYSYYGANVIGVSKKEWMFLLSDLTIVVKRGIYGIYHYEGIFEIIREKDL